MSSTNQNTSSGDRINSTLPASLSMDPAALDTFYSVLGVSISVVGLIANMAVILVFIAHRRLRTKINGFLVSLAVADLLLTGISLPLEIEWHIRSEFIHGVFVCELIYTIYFLTLTSSSLNLLVISIYRYLSIACPFFMKRVTSFHVLLAIGAVWVYSGVTALLPLLGWRSNPSTVYERFCDYSFEFNFAVFVLTANWLIPAVLVFVFYGLIFRIARIHAIKILKNQVLSEKEKTRSPLFKGVKTLAKIAAVYLICWFPYVIETLIVFSGVPYSPPRQVHYTFVFLCYASAAINPFLYAGLCRDFREVFRKCAAKTCNQLYAVFRRFANSCRRIAAALSADGRRNSGENMGRRLGRTRTTSGSSSVYHQNTVGTVVWSGYFDNYKTASHWTHLNQQVFITATKRWQDGRLYSEMEKKKKSTNETLIILCLRKRR